MSLRLLVNENFPAPSVPVLRAAGYDVFSIVESCAGMVDGEVLSLAVQHNRWLITFDRDYGELIFARGHPPPPAVILLRVANYRPEDAAQWVLRLTQEANACLGRFSVFDGATIRARPLVRTVG